MGAIVTSRLGGAAAGASPPALATALHPIFVVGIALAAVVLGAVLFIPHIELKQTLEERPLQVEVLEEAA
jgi:hypothetical protein